MRVVMYLFIGMLLSLSLKTYAENNKKNKVSSCMINGTSPIQGGETCQFSDNFVIVHRCAGSPCKVPESNVTEDPDFECSDDQPSTPGWVSSEEMEKSLVSYYEERAFKVSKKHDDKRALMALENGETLYFFWHGKIAIEKFLAELQAKIKNKNMKNAALVFDQKSGKFRAHRVERDKLTSLSSVYGALESCPVSSRIKGNSRDEIKFSN